MISVCISSAEHDSSICILEDEKVFLCVQEERISKVKHDATHPCSSIKLIKKYFDEIDNLIFVNCNYDHEYYVNFLAKENVVIRDYFIDVQQHHLYHASSAFYGSGFDDAICLVIDGWGASFDLGDIHGSETTSIYYGSYPANFELLYKNIYYNPKLITKNDEIKSLEKQYKWECSSHLDVGVAYGTVSKYIGFGRLDGGKTMGLSSYGVEDNSIPDFNIKDTIYTDKNLLLSDRSINEKLFPEIICSENDLQKKANIAYKVQKYLEKVFLYRVEQALKLKPDCKNLVFSGGCALNILGNSLIKKHFPDINFYVDPIANDACQAYGASKYYYYKNTECMKKDPLHSLYTGPKYNLDEMKKLVEYEVMKYNKIEEN
jgi:carbamoyltransferase